MKGKMSWIDTFLKLMFPVDSSDVRLERAHTLKYRNLPRKIYRYVSASERNIEAIRSGNIWLCDPKRYNDPYDCVFTIDYTSITTHRLRTGMFDEICEKMPKITSAIQDRKEEILSNPNPWAQIQKLILDQEEDEEMKREIEKAINIIQQKFIEGMIEHTYKKVIEALKVCSFSTCYDSFLMWAHYANDHKGICIEYDTTGFQYSDYRARFLWPVVYTDTLLDITDLLVNDEKNINIYRYTLPSLYKSQCWRYESEWRLVFPHGVVPDEQAYYFGKPKKVFLGSRIDAELQQEIEKLSDANGIELRKMVLSKYKYKLEDRNLMDAKPFFPDVQGKA